MEEVLKEISYKQGALTESDRRQLTSLIVHFLVNYPVQEARTKLRELYKSWIYHSYECADPKQIKAMLLFYMKLLAFINACYAYTKGVESME